jgi:hypothetical protein
MNWEDLGLAAVILCNLLFLSLCTYMAWRMLNHMRDSQSDLSAYADSLKAHASRLNRTADDTLGTFGDVKRELARLIETTRSGLAALRSAPQANRPSDPYQQWAARDPKGLKHLIGQQGDMLDQVTKVDAARFAEWRQGKQAELDELVKQKEQVQQEFEKLWAAHDETRQQLHAEELRNRQLQAGAGEAQALRQELDGLREQLQHAEARAFAAEQLAQAAEDADGNPSAPNPAASRVKELASQLAQAEAERRRLRRELATLQDNLKRTLTEKEFIEDRFLALDAGQAPAEAAEAQAVAA